MIRILEAAPMDKKLSKKRRASKKLEEEINFWMRRIRPQLPDIDPGDLHLILWGFLRQKHGGKLHFLLRKKKYGSYVF